MSWDKTKGEIKNVTPVILPVDAQREDVAVPRPDAVQEVPASVEVADPVNVHQPMQYDVPKCERCNGDLKPFGYPERLSGPLCEGCVITVERIQTVARLNLGYTLGKIVDLILANRLKEATWHLRQQLEKQ